MAKKVSIKVIKLPKPNAKLNMSIMHPLNKDTLTKQVLKAKVGNYALGIRIQKNNRFIFKPLYVGRSDTDLNKEIQQQGLTLKVDANRKPLHTHFKYSYVPDIMAAFLKECNNFHDFGGKDHLEHNDRHPARPSGYTKITLPCSEIGCKD